MQPHLGKKRIAICIVLSTWSNNNTHGVCTLVIAWKPHKDPVHGGSEFLPFPGHQDTARVKFRVTIEKGSERKSPRKGV